MFDAGPASPALFGFELEAPTTVNEAAATRAARSRVVLFSASPTPKTARPVGRAGLAAASLTVVGASSSNHNNAGPR